MLSLIIPTYNCADYLEETIGSVISQLPDDFELVIVDDGSDDGTAGLLDRYQRSYDGNVRVILHDHQGVSSARNAGIDAASGEWITFMDCDDCLMDGFFEKCRSVFSDDADLYIFSFEQVELHTDADEESVLPLTVADRLYESSSEFADEYIRTRHLLVYSACNKFYRKSLLDKYNIRFRNGMEFGEDRLFNYDYFPVAGRIVTSSIMMFRYMQRNPDSASKRSFPDYFNTIMLLHKAKTDCFLSLSKGTSGAEKRAFIGYDLSTEIERMADRFERHPSEKSKNLPLINRLIFGEPEKPDGPFDILVVLGSTNCGYRAEKALEIGARNPETIYIVSGGNMYADGIFTEAEFMSEVLKSHGISNDRIIVENEAVNTYQNLKLSAEIIEKMDLGASDPRIGIVTAAFHTYRTRTLLDRMAWFREKDAVIIPAYGPHTGPDNWYDDPYGRQVCLSEIAKRFMYIEEPDEEPAYSIVRVDGDDIDWSSIPKLAIDKVLWTEDTGIRAEGQLCRSDDALYVHMRAFEENIKAEYTEPLSPVCNDSCLEFFFMIEGEENYFNFEVNPNGCMCIQFGKKERFDIVQERYKQYFDVSTDRTPDGWEVFYRIPVSFIRMFYPGYSFDRDIMANMYKCGNHTVHKHFVAWAAVETEQPNFHMPEFFRKMTFL